MFPRNWAIGSIQFHKSPSGTEWIAALSGGGCAIRAFPNQSNLVPAAHDCGVAMSVDGKLHVRAKAGTNTTHLLITDNLFYGGGTNDSTETRRIELNEEDPAGCNLRGL